MADVYLVRRGDGLFPVNPSDLDAVRKLPIGKPCKASVVQPRNLAFHRRAFALMNMAFDYWEPETLVTRTESETVRKLGQFLVANGMSQEAAHDVLGPFTEHLAAQREGLEFGRSFEAFRDWLTVEAGYYRLIQTPNGPRKDPRSISFAAMDGDSFAQYYRAIFNVLWRVILSRSFPNEQAAQNAVDQLLSFE